jgi:hypothetical protein
VRNAAACTFVVLLRIQLENNMDSVLGEKNRIQHEAKPFGLNWGLYRKRVAHIAVSAAMMMSSLTASALVYDAAGEFEYSLSTTGPWSYGYSTTLTGAIVGHNEIGTYNPYIEYMRTNINSGTPSIIYNTNTVAETFGSVIIGANELGIHPGPNNEYEKVRLTVGTSGMYSIVGAFSGLDIYGTSTDAHILLNNVDIFSAMVNGFGLISSQSFSILQSLNVGDTLDFAVGNGAGLPYAHYNDSTALSAHVTLEKALPLPGGAALTGLGILCLLGLRNKYGV